MDIIEAGFPIASPDDFAAVKAIAEEVGNAVDADGYVPVICGLSRTRPADLETAWNAVKGAARPRVHTFIATSEIHMVHKLRMSRDQVTQAAVDAVRHLRALGCVDIEFSPEDAGRSDPEFLYEILAEVIKAGATTLNIPDTTGWNLPHEFQVRRRGSVSVWVVCMSFGEGGGAWLSGVSARGGSWGSKALGLGHKERQAAGRPAGSSAGGSSKERAF